MWVWETDGVETWVASQLWIPALRVTMTNWSNTRLVPPGRGLCLTGNMPVSIPKHSLFALQMRLSLDLRHTQKPVPSYIKLIRTARTSTSLLLVSQGRWKIMLSFTAVEERGSADASQSRGEEEEEEQFWKALDNTALTILFVCYVPESDGKQVEGKKKQKARKKKHTVWFTLRP